MAKKQSHKNNADNNHVLEYVSRYPVIKVTEYSQHPVTKKKIIVNIRTQLLVDSIIELLQTNYSISTITTKRNLNETKILIKLNRAKHYYNEYSSLNKDTTALIFLNALASVFERFKDNLYEFKNIKYFYFILMKELELDFDDLSNINDYATAFLKLIKNKMNACGNEKLGDNFALTVDVARLSMLAFCIINNENTQ